MSNNRRNKNSKSSREKTDSAVMIALIGAAVTILVAILGFPPLVVYLTPSTAIPTTIHLEYSETPIGDHVPDALLPSPAIIDTSTPSPTLWFTPLPPLENASPTITTTGLPIGMQVILNANQTSGRAPLTVKLDARTSYLSAPDGTIFECRKGACRYTWYVYFNGAQYIEPLETRGNVDFKFDKRGTYFVSVYICHGAEQPICASGGTVIIVE